MTSSFSPGIFFCFSNHQETVFLFFLLLSLPSSVLQQHLEGGNFLSEFDQSNWPLLIFNFLCQLLVSSSFFKLSRKCVLILPNPFTSVICPSMASWRRQFLLRICPIQLAFLRRILFRSVLFSPIRSIISSLVTFSDHFSFCTLFQNYISKLSMYFHYNFLSIQVSYFQINLYLNKMFVYKEYRPQPVLHPRNLDLENNMLPCDQ